jgi:hypothetical protein
MKALRFLPFFKPPAYRGLSARGLRRLAADRPVGQVSPTHVRERLFVARIGAGAALAIVVAGFLLVTYSEAAAQINKDSEPVTIQRPALLMSPVGALPAQDLAKIDRLKLTSKGAFKPDLKAWVDALKTATEGELSSVLYQPPLITFLAQLDPLFEKGQFHPTIARRYFARLKQLPPNTIHRLEKTLEAITEPMGERASKLKCVGYLIQFDRFFPDEAFSRQEGDLLIGRLQSLNPDAIKRWEKAMDTYPSQAAVALATSDGLFEQGRFNQRSFDEALKLTKTPPKAAGAPRTVARAAALAKDAQGEGDAKKATPYYRYTKQKGGLLKVYVYNTAFGDPYEHQFDTTPRSDLPRPGVGSRIINERPFSLWTQHEGHVLQIDLAYPGGTPVVKSVSLDKRKIPLGPEPRLPSPRAGGKQAPAPASEVDPEREAAAKLKLAKMLEKDGLADKAKARYQEILNKYPGSKAAEEARHLLGRMSE